MLARGWHGFHLCIYRLSRHIAHRLKHIRRDHLLRRVWNRDPTCNYSHANPARQFGIEDRAP